MLADYPAIVDYNFSPVQSPLFHQDVHSDDIFVPGHIEDEIDLPLGADFHVGLTNDLPLLLDDDDVGIQTSDQGEDLAQMQEAGTRCHGIGGQDAPIVEGGACEEGLFGSAGSDYLSQGYLSAMQHSSLEGDPSLALLTLVASDLDGCIASNVEVSDLPGSKSRIAGERPASLTTTSETREGRRRRKKKKTEDKRWSEMTEDEKDDVAERLTSVLRSLLGPRERMEVLAMILPERRARLSDRDFVIESHMLNESTLAKLETYLEENEMTGEASDSELVLSQPGRKRGCFAGTGRRKCTSLPASPQHRGSFAEDQAPPGGRKSSKRQTSLRTWRRSTRKEYRQASKERRSGLFHREEVLSLSQCIQEDEDEEEEIDILG